MQEAGAVGCEESDDLGHILGTADARELQFLQQRGARAVQVVIDEKLAKPLKFGFVTDVLLTVVSEPEAARSRAPSEVGVEASPATPMNGLSSGTLPSELSRITLPLSWPRSWARSPCPRSPTVMNRWPSGSNASREPKCLLARTSGSAVKMTFPKGAALPDPAGLFNASLDGNTRRAIDFREGASLDEQALKALFKAAAAANKA